MCRENKISSRLRFFDQLRQQFKISCAKSFLLLFSFFFSKKLLLRYFSPFFLSSHLVFKIRDFTLVARIYVSSENVWYWKLKLLTHIHLLPACFDNAVGVNTPDIIPDSFMRASTVHSGNYLPSYARLHGDRGDGWCASYSDDTPNDWLQIDFGKIIKVCGVATQGDINGNEWITEFKLSFSSSGDSWKNYMDTNGVRMVRFYCFLKH